MLLTPSEIKPLLLHYNLFVRKLAAKYFESCGRRDEDLAPLLIEAFSKYKKADCLTMLHHARRWPVAESDADKLLTIVERAFAEVGPDRSFSAIKIFDHAPLDIVLPRRERILALHMEPEKHSRFLDARIRLREINADDLFSHLYEYAEQFEVDDDKQQAKIDWKYVEAIVAELAPRDTNEPAILARTMGAEDWWVEVFLMDLCAERRLPEAVPYLMEKLEGEEDDWTFPRVGQALGKIGDTAQTMPLILEAWPRLGSYARNVLSESMPGLAASDDGAMAEAGLIQLFNNPNLELEDAEEDASVRFFLCMTLCEMFSDMSVTYCLKWLDEDNPRISDGLIRYDSDVQGIMLSAYDALKSVDLHGQRDVAPEPLPAASQKWRVERLQQWRRMQSIKLLED